MHSFKSGVKVIFFISILVALIKICDDLVAEQAFSRLMMHDMYNHDENYTLAFLGASRTFMAFDPSIFDENLDKCNSVNLGSVSQTLEGTYFLLKEFLNLHHPNMIIMEISYGCYEDEVWEKHTPTPEYWLFDYMRPSINKVGYYFSVFNKENYANALFPCYRNRSKLELSKIGEQFEQKYNSGYYQYLPFTNSDGWNYLSKGFVESHWCYANKDLEPREPYEWDKNLIMESKIKYLKKITDLCLSKDIDIIWITAPYPVYSLIDMGNYNEAHDYFDALAKKYNVEYYDFNYCHSRMLERNDYIYFYDASHMNNEYAKKFSNLVCQILTERANGSLDYDNYFYRTFEEMIQECNEGSLYNYIED